MENLLLLCVKCHREIHRDEVAALRDGWMCASEPTQERPRRPRGEPQTLPDWVNRPHVARTVQTVQKGRAGQKRRPRPYKGVVEQTGHPGQGKRFRRAA